MRRAWVTPLLLIALSVDGQLQDRYVRTGLMIWNIGQGQFVTATRDQICEHWDMGGEYLPLHLQTLCRNKINKVYFSHWDWDHLGLAWKTQSVLPNLCVAAAPLGDNKHAVHLAQISPCPKAPSGHLVYWRPPPFRKKPSSNSLSQVWLLNQWALMPGDSPRQQEKLWSQQMPHLRNTRVLVLGHHGSHTSTSETLLRHLPHLQMAIASSRWARYHHPAPVVVARLKKHGIAVLKTEDWGSILIEAPDQIR